MPFGVRLELSAVDKGDAEGLWIKRILKYGDHLTTEWISHHSDLFVYPNLQAWIDRFAFQRQYAENVLMHAAQRLSPDESFQRFDAKRKLPQGP
jgi:hypothetical protein